MRPLEIVIPLLLAVYLLGPHPRPFMIRLVPSLALVITLFHFYFEGFRWQMIPLYALTSLLVLSSLLKINGSGDWKTIASTLTAVLLALITIIPILLPVPKIPDPSGPFEIGTVIHELTDFSRKEMYSGIDEPRRFTIQVWYPASPSKSDKRAPWMANAEIYAPAIASYIDLPSYFLNHLALVKIPAYKNAQVASSDDGFPVILFSHGWNGFNAQNTGQALELASRGYIVIGIQHTYGAVITVFPDGSVVPNNPAALLEDENDPNYEIVARKLVDQWAGDMSFVLDQLESGDLGESTGADSAVGVSFLSKAKLDRIGVYGHSTGGGAAIQFCGTDPRCKAVLGMDPFIRPVSVEVIENGITQPAFFMFSQGWADLVDSRNNQLFNRFYPNVPNSKGAISITGTKHYDFSDLPLLSPIAPQLGLKGPLNGRRVTTIVNAYLTEFFEMTLSDKPSALFDGSFDDFGEVHER